MPAFRKNNVDKGTRLSFVGGTTCSERFTRRRGHKDGFAHSDPFVRINSSGCDAFLSNISLPEYFSREDRSRSKRETVYRYSVIAALSLAGVSLAEDDMDVGYLVASEHVLRLSACMRLLKKAAELPPTRYESLWDAIEGVHAARPGP